MVSCLRRKAFLIRKEIGKRKNPEFDSEFLLLRNDFNSLRKRDLDNC